MKHKTKKFEIELDEMIYDLLADVAKKTGKSHQEVIIEWLNSEVAKSSREPPVEREPGPEFKKYAGIFNSDDGDASNNDRIDEVLSEEYASVQTG